MVSLNDGLILGNVFARLLPEVSDAVFFGIHGSLGARLVSDARDLDFILYTQPPGPSSDHSVTSPNALRFIEAVQQKLGLLPYHQYICEHKQMLGLNYHIEDVKASVHVVNAGYIRDACEQLIGKRSLPVSPFDLEIHPQRAYRLWVSEVIPIYDPFRIYESLPVISARDILEELIPDLVLKCQVAIYHLERSRDPMIASLASVMLCNYLILLAYATNHVFLGHIKRIVPDLAHFSSSPCIIKYCQLLIGGQTLTDSDIETLKSYLGEMSK